MKNFDKINAEVKNLIDSGVINPNIGEAQQAIPVKIQSISKHAEERMKERGLSLEQAQTYIDDAEVMFVQDSGRRQMYLSTDGSSTLLVSNAKLLSVYGKDQFDPAIHFILEVVKNVD